MVSDVDLMASADLDVYGGLWERFRRLTARRAGRPTVVGQIIPRGVRTVSENMNIAELVPLMADIGLRHVPVVDARRRLSGIISQSDLLAALYRG